MDKAPASLLKVIGVIWKCTRFISGPNPAVLDVTAATCSRGDGSFVSVWMCQQGPTFPPRARRLPKSPFLCRSFNCFGKCLCFRQPRAFHSVPVSLTSQHLIRFNRPLLLSSSHKAHQSVSDTVRFHHKTWQVWRETRCCLMKSSLDDECVSFGLRRGFLNDFSFYSVAFVIYGYLVLFNIFLFISLTVLKQFFCKCSREA